MLNPDTTKHPHMNLPSMVDSFNHAAEDTMGEIPKWFTNYFICFVAMQKNAERAMLLWFTNFDEDQKILYGHKGPTLVLPGFLTDDKFTYPLRKALNDNGYTVYGWDNGENDGPTLQALQHLESRIEEIYRLEKRPVTLIGHSLGGIFARELARVRPDMVKEVITLGSPYSKDEQPVPVPVTSIFTPTDEVVRDWRKFIRKEHNFTQVDGSHVDLVRNPHAIDAVLDALKKDDPSPALMQDTKKYSSAPEYHHH